MVLNDFVKLINFIIKSRNVFGIFDAVSENLSVTQIVKIIKKYKKNLKIQFVNTKILNQKSYVVIPDAIVNKGFKFSGKVKNEIKKQLKY